MNFLKIDAPAEGGLKRLFDPTTESGTVQKRSGNSDKDEGPDKSKNHRQYMPVPGPEFTDERRVEQDR